MRYPALLLMTTLIAACGGSDESASRTALNGDVSTFGKQAQQASQALDDLKAALAEQENAASGPANEALGVLADEQDSQTADHATLKKRCRDIEARIEQEVANTPELAYATLNELTALQARQADNCASLAAMRTALAALEDQLAALAGLVGTLDEQVDNAASKLADLKALAANIELVAGPQGPQGPQGVAGPPGQPGPEGLTLYPAEAQQLHSDFMASVAGERQDFSEAHEQADGRIRKIERTLQTLLNSVEDIQVGDSIDIYNGEEI